MHVQPYGMQAHRAYTYNITVVPEVLAVSPATFICHAKLNSATPAALIDLYLRAAITYAEQFMRRDLITRTYQTFRDFFPNNTAYGYGQGFYPNIDLGNEGFEIRRSKLQTITSIKYLKDAVLTLVDSSIYYNTVEHDYSKVLTLAGQSWPTDVDQRLQAIEIIFKAGFGDDEDSIPQDIKSAILAHATALNARRGDCAEPTVIAQGSIVSTLPPESKMVYLQNRIENL